eukprot:3562290-Rhodomonas_salina.1
MGAELAGMFTEGGVYGALVALTGLDIKIEEIESGETSEDYDYYRCDNGKPLPVCFTAEEVLSESSSDSQPPQLCPSPSIRTDNSAEWMEATRLECTSLNKFTTLELRMPTVDGVVINYTDDELHVFQNTLGRLQYILKPKNLASASKGDDYASWTSDPEPQQQTPAEWVNTTNINIQSNNVGVSTYGLVLIVTLAIILGVLVLNLEGVALSVTWSLFLTWSITSHGFCIWHIHAISMGHHTVTTKVKKVKEKHKAAYSRNKEARAAQAQLSFAGLINVRISENILPASAMLMKSLRLVIDSGCAISIISDSSLLKNIRQIKLITVQGVTGDHEVCWAGDLHFDTADNSGTFRTLVVNNVLLDEESPANLVSAYQLKECGFATIIDPEDVCCSIILNQHSTEPVIFLLKLENKIFSLYTPDNTTEISDKLNTELAVITKSMSFIAGNMLLEELMHL